MNSTETVTTYTPTHNPEFEFPCHSIPTVNSSFAQTQRCHIHTLTPTPSLRIKRITRKLVITVACLTSCAIRIKPTALRMNITALQLTRQETVFSRLFLLGARGIPRRQVERVDQGLILADTVREHVVVVTIVIYAPLYFQNVVCRVAGHYGGAPVGAGLVIVDTDASIVAAWSAAADLGGFEVGPGCDRFEDPGALGAGVDAGL